MRRLRCLVDCFGLVGLAWLIAALISPALAAVQPVSPYTKAQPETSRHIPKGCTNPKPREIIRLRLFKMDKDGKLVQVSIVVIPKNC